ncbi:hypothetical protein ACQ4PT_016663 [Festuca glaucescens]
MGLIDIFMAVKRDQRRRQIQSSSLPVASAAKRKVSSCQKDDYSEVTKIPRYSGPYLPEDIWCQIHALLPLQDAARAGCVSHDFLNSWRCRPNLTLSEKTLGLKENAFGGARQARYFTKIVDGIMKKHSGIGVKTFTLQYCGSCIQASHLNNWLQIAVTPGLEELVLSLPPVPQAEYYNFPCPFLLNGRGDSIRNLNLTCCAFHPLAGLGCLRKLHLYQVHITGDELECLLSNSFVLEKLNLMHCNKIICLKILCLLKELNHLTVFECATLEVIENKAPNLSTVRIDGALIRLPFGDSLQVKDLEILCSSESNLVHYACAELPLIMPNLETLAISSVDEILNTPVLPAKFLHLKELEISLGVSEGPFSPAYDYFSLVYFLDACPGLETFILAVLQTRMKHRSISGNCSGLRLMPERHHASINNVKIIGFCSAKSMVELTCHILDSATSLVNLTLDTIYDGGYESTDRLAVHEIGHCSPIGKHMIMEADKALLAIDKYIVPKVPSRVNLNIKKPCSRCHAL